MGSVDPLLSVQHLDVRFPGSSGWAHAVRDVSLSVAPGEVLGVVGESGSGKSVTSLAIMRLLAPESRVGGSIRFEGVDLLSLPADRMRRYRGRRIAMIFQEPMTALNPVMRIGHQIAEAVRTHHPEAGRREAMDRAVEALRTVALPEPERRVRDYPHQFSGGQRQRIMIAMALVNRPQLLIADEPTTALDVTVQAQILRLLAGLRRDFGLSMLFISHDLGVVAQVADRVAVMYRGQVVETGATAQLFRAPQHPYTRGLLGAVPTMHTDRTRPLATLDRAPQAGDSADLREVGPGHFVRA